MSELLPAGTTLQTAPFTFIRAIRMALVVLSWQDNLEKRFMPPKSLWLDDDGIEEWFKGVEKVRNEEMSGKSSPSNDGGKRNEAVKLLIAE